MKKWLKRILFWGILIAIIGFIAWRFFGPKEVEPPESYTPAAGDVQSTISINATLVPDNYANISAETLSEVTAVHVSVGDTVMEDQKLVTLDQAALATQIRSAQLAVDSAVEQEQAARRKSANTSSAQRKVLKNASEQARQRLHELYTLRSKGVLTSPIAGVVTIQNARVGEVITGTTSPVAGVTAGTVIRIIDALTLHVEAFVSESDIIDLRVGQSATMTFDALPDESFDAVISQIDPEASSIQDVIYFKTEFEISGLNSKLRSGMSGDIDIITQESSNVLTIPLRFVRNDDDGQYVNVADGTDEKGQATYAKKYIQTGIEGDDGFAEVLDGLNNGETIYNIQEDEDE